MLTQIRHIQKGVLIAVTVIIVVSFAFLYSDFDFVEGTLGRQDCVVKVYDHCYRLKEAQQLANHFNVALELGMYDFATVLFGENRQDQDRTDFIMSLVILRREAEKLGIEPSAEEIKAAIPSLPIFQQPWVTAEMVENRILGPNGFTQGDLAQLVKDYLSFQRLRDLIGAGIAAVPSETGRRYIQANQRYTATVVAFNRDDYAKDLKITDEDIAKYYEENKDELLSEPKRGFDYVKFSPKALPEDATNEAKAKANLDFANAVNRAYADLAADEAKFMEIAKQYTGEKANFTGEVATLEPFPRNEAPDLLKDNAEAVGELFSGAAQVGEVSVPVSGEGGAYLVFHFTKSIEPTSLTLEQATPAIREALAATRSNRAVNDAASAALAKLNEAVKAGKSFAGAAKELNLKTETLEAFSESEPPAGYADASVLVRAVSGLEEKGISAVTERTGGTGYLVAHVDKIVIYKDEEAEAKKSSLAASIKNRTDRTLFTAWFNQRRKESGSRRPDTPTMLQ
ncbi:MAG: peptidyl-prolyl cis-trans isomerase [Verrucomicrobiae bacterium]|nr:peptidyl-prolyl cis-trans isomerase [Verrucomicrobiae bacterium]